MDPPTTASTNGGAGRKTWARIYLFYLHLAVRLRGAETIEARLHQAMMYQQSRQGNGRPAGTLCSSTSSLLNYFGDHMLERLCRLNPEDQWAEGYERFLARLPGRNNSTDGDSLAFCKWLYATLTDLHILEPLPKGVPYLSPRDLKDLTSDHGVSPWSDQGSPPMSAAADPSVHVDVASVNRGATTNTDNQEDDYYVSSGFPSRADSLASAITSPLGSSTGLSRLSTPSIHSDDHPPVTTAAAKPPVSAPRPEHEPDHEPDHDEARRDRRAPQAVVAQKAGGPLRPLPPASDHRVNLPTLTRSDIKLDDYHRQQGRRSTSPSYSFMPYSSLPAVAPALQPRRMGEYHARYSRYERSLSPTSPARIDSALERMLPGRYAVPYYSSMSTPPAYFTEF